MSHTRAKIRGHSKGYPRGHGHSGSSLDGRLAYDIVEAVYVIQHEEARKKQAMQRSRPRAPITLAVMPWEDRE